MAKLQRNRSQKHSTRVPQWLNKRIKNTNHEGVRYESSLYGPGNGWFSTVFLTQGRFLVKPQPTLRRHVDSGRVAWWDDATDAGQSEGEQPGEEDEDQNDVVNMDISFDSQADTVAGRRRGGHEEGATMPDFIIASSTSSTTSDRIIAGNPGGEESGATGDGASCYGWRNTDMDAEWRDWTDQETAYCSGDSGKDNEAEVREACDGVLEHGRTEEAIGKAFNPSPTVVECKV